MTMEGGRTEAAVGGWGVLIGRETDVQELAWQCVAVRLAVCVSQPQACFDILVP